MRVAKMVINVLSTCSHLSSNNNSTPTITYLVEIGFTLQEILLIELISTYKQILN